MAEQLPKQLCLSLLEIGVHDIPELRQVKITATLDLAKGGTPLNYKGYLSLLLTSASLYNKGNNLSNSCILIDPCLFCLLSFLIVLQGR
jgi:hypothetical protein